MLREFFNGKELNCSINPDEAIAHGATLKAAVIAGIQNNDYGDIVFIDTTALSLGVKTFGDKYEKLIERCTNIPVTSKAKVFSTAKDYQAKVDIQIYEGEREFCKDNNSIGKFTLKIPPAPQGVPVIEVVFNVSIEGVLSVQA